MGPAQVHSGSVPTPRWVPEVTMYARVNIIFGSEDRVGPGVAHIEKSDRDVVEAAAGNRGLTTLVNRKTGVIVAMSYWDDLRHSSEAALTKAREGAAEAAG